MAKELSVEGPRPPRVSFTKRQLSPDAKHTAVQQYQQGRSPVAIADELGISRSTVMNLVEKAGVPRRIGRMTEEDRANAIALYESGLSLAAVGTRIGRDPATVRNALIVAGVQRRDTHGN